MDESLEIDLPVQPRNSPLPGIAAFGLRKLQPRRFARFPDLFRILNSSNLNAAVTDA